MKNEYDGKFATKLDAYSSPTKFYRTVRSACRRSAKEVGSDGKFLDWYFLRGAVGEAEGRFGATYELTNDYGRRIVGE